jgi:peptide/nickel transport system ATP-binding protein
MLVEPSAGRIAVDGTDLTRLSGATLRQFCRKVQIVFQDPYRSLNPRRPVGSSIAEGLTNFGMGSRDARQRARELMTLVRLDPDGIDRFPHEFSGGQRQRICIARALALEPAILIADEAVSALDVSVQADVLRLLDDIRKRLDLTLVFITHDLRVAAQISDRVAVMLNGEIVESGRTGDVFARPQHVYTRALFDAAPGASYFAAPHSQPTTAQPNGE